MKNITPFFHKSLIDKIEGMEYALRPYLDKQSVCDTTEMIAMLADVLQYKEQLQSVYDATRSKLAELEQMVEGYYDIHAKTRIRMRRYHQLIQHFPSCNNDDDCGKFQKKHRKKFSND